MNGLPKAVPWWAEELGLAIAGTATRETDRAEYVPKSIRNPWRRPRERSRFSRGFLKDWLRSISTSQCCSPERDETEWCQEAGQ